MELWPGKTTALVGASGSGKSTIVQLIFRCYDPSAGQISVDGVDLKGWDTTHLHRCMALVSQEPLLFDTTIRQNLLYGIPEFSHADDPAAFEQVTEEAAKADC